MRQHIFKHVLVSNKALFLIGEELLQVHNTDGVLEANGVTSDETSNRSNLSVDGLLALQVLVLKPGSSRSLIICVQVLMK